VEIPGYKKVKPSRQMQWRFLYFQGLSLKRQVSNGKLAGIKEYPDYHFGLAYCRCCNNFDSNLIKAPYRQRKLPWFKRQLSNNTEISSGRLI